MVLALRRQKSPFPRLEARLAGLDPDGRYEWRSLDGDATHRGPSALIHLTGRELMEQGISIEIAEKPGSALFVYKRVA
jgi:hypothetical protein